MSEIIITSPEELRRIVVEAVSEAVKAKTETKPAIDSMGMESAVKFLAEIGYPTSKAKIYKLTSTNKIPHKKYGNKLLFSRKELIEWTKSQTSLPHSKAEAVLYVSRSARNMR